MIRLGKLEDSVVLEKIELACFKDSWSEALIAQGIKNSLDTYFLLDYGNEVCGYGVLRIIKGEGEIQRIAVLPQYRQRGYGRQLMDSLVLFSQREKVEAIFLEVRESNLPARNLYKSYGFCDSFVRKEYYSDPVEDGVVMVRSFI